MRWSPQQEHAIREVAAFLRDPSRQIFCLMGVAGSGKTTLAKYLVQNETMRWLFAAYSGKASNVLRQKGCDGACTIHSLIYRPAGESLTNEIRLLRARLAIAEDDNEDPEHVAYLRKMLHELTSENQPRFSIWANSPLSESDVAGVVIDECSMVDRYVGEDLESFKKKILVIGDPAQLPPPGAAGYFTKRRPDVMLTEVHRQARESGILRLATIVRETGQVDDTFDTEDVQFVPRFGLKRPELLALTREADQVLCGTNKTRREMNRMIRADLGNSEPVPETGERLICLRNDRQEGLFNGSQWIVKSCFADTDSKSMDVVLANEDDDEWNVDVVAWMHHLMGDDRELNDMSYDERKNLHEFDWSYALTVHKAQGSQWDHVLLIDQSKFFRNDATKWLYTGITRAAKKLTVIM